MAGGRKLCVVVWAARSQSSDDAKRTTKNEESIVCVACFLFFCARYRTRHRHGRCRCDVLNLKPVHLFSHVLLCFERHPTMRSHSFRFEQGTRVSVAPRP